MELKNVMCETPEQFHQECLKWAGKALVRGRKLIAYGEVVATLASQSDIRQVIGGRIKDLRTAQNLTQQQLADMAGVTKPNICNIERGAYSVGLDILNKIATALGAEIQLVSQINQ